MALAPGDSFGDYVVVRRLGKGGMGEVWLLRSPSGVEVAAKILNAASAEDHAARRRFLREAELARGMRHPNLVETYDVGEDPETGLCYILMEYMSGGTLADRLKAKGAMDISDAVSVLRAIASVLELGRKNGIVHRDIKPANIMFAANGVPKLADLGIARGSPSGTDATTMTQTGMLIGTPAYMAPEQMLDSHHVDARADIYSLGVVFFEMLTGERPNKGDTVIQLMAKAMSGEPLPDVRTLRPEVSASLAQLLNLMVVPDRNGRIQTPGQVANAIDAISRTGKFEPPKLRQNPSPKDGAGNRRNVPWGHIAIAVGLAALSVAAAVFVYKARMSPAAIEQPAVPPVRTHAEAVPRPAAPATNVVRKVAARPVRKVGDAEPRPFEIRSSYRGGKPAQGWLAIRSNGMFDVKMTAESVLSGDGDVERVVCMCYPQPCVYQGIRWYGDEPKMLAFSPETSDWYLRIAEKGCHLKDVDVAFEFNVACKSARVDFSKVDGRVPYNKAASQYKAFTRDWRTANPGRVRISLAHPWIVARRNELLSAAGDDHLAYASRAYGLVAGSFSVSGEDADISKTIERRGGSVCAVASVFVSLLRSAGIPARTLCGKRADGSAVFVPEFYLEGCGWIPAGIARDVGRKAMDHFGVYDEACVVLSSDLDVSIQAARGEVCRLERLSTAWWWFYKGQWTPCETFFGWQGSPASEESFGRRKEAASADLRKQPRPQPKATQTVVFPILDRAPDAWAYSFEEERGWRDPCFDDSGWKRAPGGFGHKEGGGQISMARTNTDWDSKRIFLRRRFNWSGGDVSRVVVDAYHDDDMAVYLNGRLMLTVNGFNFGWQPFEIPARRFARALRNGENVLCVEVRQVCGAQYFDCGLVVECGGEVAAHAGPDGVRMVKTANGTWTVVVKDGVAQIGNGRDAALDPRPRGSLKIPAELDGLAIRKLAQDCFARCGELESVEIPEGVRSIGRGAFLGCGRLERVALPDTLEYLGAGSLCGSNIRAIDLKNVRLVDSGAFRSCNGLNAVNVDVGNPKYRVKDGVLYDKVRRSVVFFPRLRSSYSFPSGIEEIDDCAFQHSLLKSVSIPKTVKFVGHSAFKECPRLESVRFRGDDVDIRGWAFGNMPALRTVVLPAGLRALDGFSIFRNAGRLEEIVLPDTLEVIDDNVFRECPRLRKVEFGKSLEAIRHHAFASCPCLKSVSLPASLKKMGAEVFLDCRSLESVSFAGDAPVFFDQDKCLGVDMYRGTSPSLVTFVPRGSKGWHDGGDELPKAWPVGGEESARPIRHGK